jgi:hypothetical protein
MPYYEAYGLVLRCDFDLDIQKSHARDVDVVIEFVTELNRPKNLSVTEYNKKSVISYNSNYTEFNWEDCGSVACIDGNKVQIEKSSNFDRRIAAIGILSMGLGVILQQKAIVNLHASAVQGPNGALVFAGDSGRGKSTALNFFMRNGMKFISDDICRFDLCADSGTLRVMGGVPLVKCFDDSPSYPDRCTEPLGPVHRGTDKKMFKVKPEYVTATSVVDSIFILNWSDDTHTLLRVDSNSGLGAVESILRYSYGMSILKYYGVSVQYLKKVRDIVNESKIYTITGKRSMSALESLTDTFTRQRYFS